MKITANITPLPTYVADPVAHDCARIQNALRTYHFAVSSADAAVIREAIRPLPWDDDELLDMAAEYVFVDWSKVPERLEPTLRELKCRYTSSEDGKPSRFVELQIIAVTRGLAEHPEWWDLPCHCNSCVEDGQ